MAYLRPEGNTEGKYVLFWKLRLYTEKAFVAFTVFLKTKSEHWAVETFKGASEEERRLAFCFCP